MKPEMTLILSLEQGPFIQGKAFCISPTSPYQGITPDYKHTVIVGRINVTYLAANPDIYFKKLRRVFLFISCSKKVVWIVCV